MMHSKVIVLLKSSQRQREEYLCERQGNPGLKPVLDGG